MAKSLDHIPKPLRRYAVSVASLKPDPLNAKQHSEENIDQVAESLRLFGQDQLLVVQKRGRVVRIGNARLLAARRLGWKHIAAIVVEETDVRAALRAVMDNRSAELATWDETALKCLAASAGQLAKQSEPLATVIGRSVGSIAEEMGFDWLSPGTAAAPVGNLGESGVESSSVGRLYFRMDEPSYGRLVSVLGHVMRREKLPDHSAAILFLLRTVPKKTKVRQNQ